MSAGHWAQSYYKQMSRSLILLRLYKASPLLQTGINLRLNDALNWIQQLGQWNYNITLRCRHWNPALHHISTRSDEASLPPLTFSRFYCGNIHPTQSLHHLYNWTEVKYTLLCLRSCHVVAVSLQRCAAMQKIPSQTHCQICHCIYRPGMADWERQ